MTTTKCKNCGHDIEDAKSETGRIYLHAYKYNCTNPVTGLAEPNETRLYEAIAMAQKERMQ